MGAVVDGAGSGVGRIEPLAAVDSGGGTRIGIEGLAGRGEDGVVEPVVPLEPGAKMMSGREMGSGVDGFAAGRGLEGRGSVAEGCTGRFTGAAAIALFNGWSFVR